MTIFLDIDGVLNQLQGNYHLDDTCISNLSLLCNKLNADIVLTSSWRLGYTNIGKSSPQIEKLKKKLSQQGLTIKGRTKNLNNRVKEITQYILDHNISTNDYIILDDDQTEFTTPITNLYIVNNKTGLTKQDVKALLKRYR